MHQYTQLPDALTIEYLQKRAIAPKEQRIAWVELQQVKLRDWLQNLIIWYFAVGLSLNVINI
jgi:hypothetical protein